MSEYENGSDTIDRIQHLSAQIGGRTATLSSLRNKLSLLIEEAGLKIATLNRHIAQTLEQAEKIITTSNADKAITLARSYHSSSTPVPSPDLTSPTLQLVLAQTPTLAGTPNAAVVKNADTALIKQYGNYTGRVGLEQTGRDITRTLDNAARNKAAATRQNHLTTKNLKRLK